jgi:hypothetical protein
LIIQEKINNYSNLIDFWSKEDGVDYNNSSSIQKMNDVWKLYAEILLMGEEMEKVDKDFKLEISQSIRDLLNNSCGFLPISSLEIQRLKEMTILIDSFVNSSKPSNILQIPSFFPKNSFQYI